MARTKQVAPRSSSSSSTAEHTLLSAVCAGNLDSIRELIAGGASLNAIVPRQNTTPLLQAVRDDNREVVRALIAGGADANIGLTMPLCGAVSVDNGDTPLLAACYNGSVQIAEDLICAGADVHGTTEQGTPLSMVMNQMDDAFIDPLVKSRLGNLLRLLRRSGATSAGTCAQPLVCLRPQLQPRVPPVADAESAIGHGSSSKSVISHGSSSKSVIIQGSSRKRERGASSSHGTATLHPATLHAAMSRADRLAARQARAAINQA